MSEVEKITFEFLWNGKDRIKRNVMCQDYKNGGIRMTNYYIDCSLKLNGYVGWDVYYMAMKTWGGKDFLTIVVDQWAEDLSSCVIMKFPKWI